MINTLFIKFLKEKRLDKGYTQEYLAKLLFISKSKYNKIENGSIEPSLTLLYLIYKILDLDINKIFDLVKYDNNYHYD